MQQGRAFKGRYSDKKRNGESALLTENKGEGKRRKTEGKGGSYAGHIQCPIERKKKKGGR